MIFFKSFSLFFKRRKQGCYLTFSLAFINLVNKYNTDRVDIYKILEQDYTVIDTRQSDLRVYIDKWLI